MAKSRKHFIPLESNPEVFTELINRLGVTDLQFQDVFSLDDPDLLAMVPRPALALILVFPTSETYEKQIADDESTRPEYTGGGPGEDVVWFKQTIRNACGLYGILHAVSNGKARSFIKPGSSFENLLTTCVPLDPHGRALALENSNDLETAHADAAKQGDSPVPTAEDEVEFHYVCFVQSNKNGHLYEMDGGKKGPVDRGHVLDEDGDVLGQGGLNLVKEFIQREKGKNLNFSLMALVSVN